MADVPTVVRRYYDALDGHDYDALAEVLAPDFVQHRPDRTFEGRDAFVRFMREDRPTTETSHDVRDVLVDGDRAVARGTLLDSGGDDLFAFADAFEFEDGRVVRLETYTR